MLRFEYVIEEFLSGIRLDKAITRLDESLSRQTVQRLLDEKNIIVNRKKPKAFI